MILFVVDVREGLLPRTRRSPVASDTSTPPVILVINKADDPKFDDQGQDFYKLGRGAPVFISTHQNRNKMSCSP